jgi:hypothetical protein
LSKLIIRDSVITSTKGSISMQDLSLLAMERTTVYVRGNPECYTEAGIIALSENAGAYFKDIHVEIGASECPFLLMDASTVNLVNVNVTFDASRCTSLFSMASAIMNGAQRNLTLAIENSTFTGVIDTSADGPRERGSCPGSPLALIAAFSTIADISVRDVKFTAPYPWGFFWAMPGQASDDPWDNVNLRVTNSEFILGNSTASNNTGIRFMTADASASVVFEESSVCSPFAPSVIVEVQPPLLFFSIRFSSFQSIIQKRE